jgi:tetratricopeptide (TPR) repeat protein
VYHNEVHATYIINACYYYFNEQYDLQKKELEILEKYDFLFHDLCLMRYQLVKGLYFMATKNYELSFDEFEKVSNYYLKQDIENSFVIYNLGWIHYYLGHHTTSVLMMDKARKLYKEQKNEYRLYDIFALMGLIHLNDGNYLEAEKIFLSCLHNEQYVLGNSNHHYFLSYHLAVTNFFKKSYNKTLSYLDKIFLNQDSCTDEVLFLLILTIKLMNNPKLYQFYQEEITNKKNKNKQLLLKLFEFDNIFDVFNDVFMKDITSLLGRNNLCTYAFYVIDNLSDQIITTTDVTTYNNVYELFLESRSLL